jgi:hypothetical protein
VLSLAQARAARYADTVALFQALGGRLVEQAGRRARPADDVRGFLPVADGCRNAVPTSRDRASIARRIRPLGLCEKSHLLTGDPHILQSSTTRGLVCDPPREAGMRGEFIAVRRAASIGLALPHRIFESVARRVENRAVADAAAGGVVVGG